MTPQDPSTPHGRHFGLLTFASGHIKFFFFDPGKLTFWVGTKNFGEVEGVGGKLLYHLKEHIQAVSLTYSKVPTYPLLFFFRPQNR